MQQEEAIKTDHYLAPIKDGEGLFKDKGSKFLGFAFRVEDQKQVSEVIDVLRSRYHDARHFCFAYRMKPEKPEVRANDDGEPSNSAGMPIYNQILAHEVWNCLVVVVRYFGGTKLGVPGLIAAYKEAAKLALDDSEFAEEYLMYEVKIRFPYSEMNNVMRIIKEINVQILSENMQLQGEYLLGVRKTDYQRFIDKLSLLHLVKIV